jgi:hypothetical protein
MKENEYVCYLEVYDRRNEVGRAQEICGSGEWSAKGGNIATLEVGLRR